MAVHFTGIKGTGMAALAGILKDEGFDVKGSDIDKYIFTQDELEKRGIPVSSFDPANIHAGDTVIAGLSFDETHPEIQKALADPTVTVYWYNEYLGKLLERYESISIAGTHGKSTTTGLLASVLKLQAPTGFLIGDGHGSMPKHARYFILESCEFKRHFLAYHPDYAIITNIELDHVDYYRDMEDYVSAFQSFADQVKKLVVVCGDDEHLVRLHYSCPYVTYGLKDGCDYQAVNVQDDEHGISFDVRKDGNIIAHTALPESGYPFLIDSLGVFAMASELGMDPETIEEGLHDYQGINRRFVIEEAGNSILIDDYAHHPTAIRYMIEAARSRYPGRKVIALYKPDRYSRLQFFLDEFAESMSLADEAILLDFPKNAVREDDTITVTIQDLIDRVPGSIQGEADQATAGKLAAEDGAVFLFMSSKDIYLLRDMVRDLLEKQPG